MADRDMQKGFENFFQGSALWTRVKRKYIKGVKWKEILGKTPAKSSDVVREFREMLLLDKMKILNELVKEIEARWDTDDSGQFGKLLEDVEKGLLLVGPFPNLSLYTKERGFYRYGTASMIEGKKIVPEKGVGKKLSKKKVEGVFKKIFQSMDWVSINICGEIFKFPIPPEMEWSLPSDSSPQHIRTWGFEFFEMFTEEYSKILDNIEEVLKHKFRGENFTDAKTGKEYKFEKAIYDGEDLKKALKHLGFVTKAMKDHVISDIFEKINDEEHNFRSTYDPIMSFYESTVGGMLDNLKKRTPKMMGKIHCAHTYRVITNDEMNVKEKLEKLDNEKKYGFKMREGEKAPGLDERGMPLEVGEDGTILADKWRKEIIENKARYHYYDIWKENKKKAINKVVEDYKEKGYTHYTYSSNPRKLNSEAMKLFTGYLPIWDIIQYTHNEWDRFRDDARDGRYHQKSLTIMEYLMAMQSRGREKKGKRSEMKEKEEFRGIKSELGSFTRWLKDWPTEKSLTSEQLGTIRKNSFSDFNETQKKVKKFRSFRMQIWGEGMKEMFEDGERTSDNLIPVFDLRAIKYLDEWEHPGIIFYYDTPDDVDCDILPPHKQAHIGSRGIAMYIMFRLLKDVKYMDDIEKICEHISGKTNGFDYGPRSYGTGFIKNPFDGAEIQRRVNALNSKQKEYDNFIDKTINEGIELAKKM